MPIRIPSIEREAGRLVLEGVRLPQIELRQVRRTQLRDIGDGRSRIQGETEDISVRVVLTLRRLALARGDGGDARRAEIRPDDAGADEAEMRRHDQPRQLLVGIVGQREHDPCRLRAWLQRADLDAPNDAVGAGRGRHLDAIALGAVALDRPGQVDRVRIGRHPDRLHRAGGPQSAVSPTIRTMTPTRPRQALKSALCRPVRASPGAAARGRSLAIGSVKIGPRRSRTCVAFDQPEQDVVAPGPVDPQESARVALTPEAVALEQRDRGAFSGMQAASIRCSRSVAKREFDRRRDRARHPPFARMRRAHPVAERRRSATRRAAPRRA